MPYTAFIGPKHSGHQANHNSYMHWLHGAVEGPITGDTVHTSQKTLLRVRIPGVGISGRSETAIMLQPEPSLRKVLGRVQSTSAAVQRARCNKRGRQARSIQSCCISLHRLTGSYCHIACLCSPVLTASQAANAGQASMHYAWSGRKAHAAKGSLTYMAKNSHNT